MDTKKILVFAAAIAALTPAGAGAAEPQRTRFVLPSSNGHGAVLVDLEARRATQFREHVFAAEEPQIDAQGQDIWDGEQFAAVHTRDLLFDAYFGVRAAGKQQWLTSVPVDLDASGYQAWAPDEAAGTGIVAMVQTIGALRATTYVYAPQGLGAASFVMLLQLENTGGQALTGVQAFSLHNFHLGYGRPKRPWEVPNDLAANGETLIFAEPKARFVERGFAGVTVTRALGSVSRRGVGPGVDLFGLVAQGGDLPNNAPPPGAVDDATSAFQWDLGDLAPGTSRWAGIAVIHHGDPFAAAEAEAQLEAYLGPAKDQASAVLKIEADAWAALQTDEVTLPAGHTPEEAPLLRQAAALLQMGQVREQQAFLREWLSKDGEPRRTRFLDLEGKPAALPTWIKHRGKGAILASLPPGEWTYAWIRDGAYATAALAALRLDAAAKAALTYYLDAEGGRFQGWSELEPYGMPPYQISLTRYYGFGVEETDFNAWGPNLEFDGFGLFLWALRAYETITGDTSVADARWGDITAKIADVLVALIDPETGLIRADSSIWETHWKGRERRYAYTSITAARGLCDAAAIAERRGDAARAETYRGAGESIRAAIAAHLTDAGGALAGNAEELALGEGYFDAAVWDAIAMGLFDPQGKIAQATIAGIDAHLRVDAGPGWSRNDDRWDHAMVEDLSPWGSEYDSAEWVITDLRGSIALRLAGDTARADALVEWVRDQAGANYWMPAETFDETSGVYKFNAPMLGFGAGAYVLALAQRAGQLSDPACGAYFDEGGGATSGSDTDTGTSGSSGEGSSGTPTTGAATSATSTTEASSGGIGTTSGGGTTAPATGGPGGGATEGCGCASGESGAGLLGLLALLAGRRRRGGTSSSRPELAGTAARGKRGPQGRRVPGRTLRAPSPREPSIARRLSA